MRRFEPYRGHVTEPRQHGGRLDHRGDLPVALIRPDRRSVSYERVRRSGAAAVTAGPAVTTALAQQRPKRMVGIHLDYGQDSDRGRHDVACHSFRVAAGIGGPLVGHAGGAARD